MRRYNLLLNGWKNFVFELSFKPKQRGQARHPDQELNILEWLSLDRKAFNAGVTEQLDGSQVGKAGLPPLPGYRT